MNKPMATLVIYLVTRRLPPCSHTPAEPGGYKKWPIFMPFLFQGAVSEGMFTTPESAAEVPPSTSEEEETHGVPTGGLVPPTHTAAPEQAATSVSVSWRFLSGSQQGEGSAS